MTSMFRAIGASLAADAEGLVVRRLRSHRAARARAACGRSWTRGRTRGSAQIRRASDGLELLLLHCVFRKLERMQISCTFLLMQFKPTNCRGQARYICAIEHLVAGQ